MGSVISRGSAIARVAIVLVCALSALAAASTAVAAGPTPHARHLEKSGRSFKGDVRRLPAVQQTGREGLIEREPPPLRPQGTFQSAPLGSGSFPGPQLPAPAPSSSFEGLHYTEDCGGVQCGDGHPPDTNGDVGPRYYIQTVNTAVGIYDKSNGTRVAGFSFNALMSQASFGNLCDTDNFGDPVVLYDSFHDRWIITDFAFQVDSSGNVVSPPGSYQCFAVSKTGDPVSGGWNFYSLHITDALQDYPKFGVWPDGLYMSANMFGFPANGTFKNVRVWSLNLAQMEAGAVNPQVVSFDAPKSAQGTQIFTLLPSNARVQAGTPPAGRPDYFSGAGGSTNSVQVFAFHVDWTNTANSTFTGPTNSLSSSSWATPPASVPSKSGNNLDTLAIRLMAQNQYSNIGGVESLWDSHTVQGASSSQAAVRWYQIPVTGGTVGTNVLQASTFNPDTANRFMSSVAVDRNADMALGYSVSSSALFPAIRYAGRVAGDPANTLGQSETSLIEGTGSQLGNCGGSACERWGDYSAMTLDPDGCTFWYTNEYYVTSSLDDHTRIGSFALPGCTPIAMGTLQGTVTDAGTASPISGAVVSAGIYSTTTDGSGNYSFPKIAAGSYTVTATAPSYAARSAGGVSVSSGGTATQNFALSRIGSPDHITITSSSADLASGSSRTLTAEVRDASNNLVTSDNSTVVTFSNASGSGTVTGLGNATASGGVASLSVTGAGAGSITIGASAAGLTSGATTFTVTPGTAAKLVFTSSTADLASGSSRTLTAEVRDPNDNLVNTSAASVVFTESAGSGSVDGLAPTSALGGRATAHVTGGLAGPVTLVAASPGLGSTSVAFTVVPGPPDHLAFTSLATDLPSGATRRLVVVIRDAHGNGIPTAGATLRLAKTAGTGTVAGLPATVAVTAGTGTRAVTGFLGGPVTITATSSGLGTASTNFRIAPGPARRRLALKLTGRILSGHIRTAAPSCRARVRIRIEKQSTTARAWKTFKRLRSGASGTFRTRISHAARYRAVVAARPGCAAATSKPLRFRAG